MRGKKISGRGKRVLGKWSKKNLLDISNDKNLIWPTHISTYVRVGETVFRRDFISGDGRTQLRLVGELRRGRGRVGVAPRVAGMVDGGVDRVDVDAARNRIWRRCRKNVQLSVGDVIGMLEVNFEIRIKLKCLFNEFVIRKCQNYLHVCVSFIIPL